MLMGSLDLGALAREAAERRAENDTYDAALEARVVLDLVPVVTRNCPFKVGDLLVQEKAYSTYTFNRRPVVVTHVFEDALIGRTVETNDMRNDILILVRMPTGNLQEFAVQSWRFEKYTGQIA